MFETFYSRSRCCKNGAFKDPQNCFPILERLPMYIWALIGTYICIEMFTEYFCIMYVMMSLICCHCNDVIDVMSLKKMEKDVI